MTAVEGIFKPFLETIFEFKRYLEFLYNKQDESYLTIKNCIFSYETKFQIKNIYKIVSTTRIKKRADVKSK